MRGIYSFVLVFLFSVCMLFLIQAGGAVRETLSEGSVSALEIERASFIRFMLEENTDAIIEQAIDMQITAGNRDSGTLNEAIASALESYFARMESEKGLGADIEFFEASTVSLSKQFTPAGSLEELGQVGEYCKTFVQAVEEHVYLAEFYFTGGLLKNRVVIGRIKVGKAEQYFLLLPGYTIVRTVVVAA